MLHRREVDIARHLAARAPDLKPGEASIYGECAVRVPVTAMESESAGRVRRDGLKIGGEASGARRGEPRCLDIRLARSCTKVVGGCFIAARLTSLGILQRAHLISSQGRPPFTANAQSVSPSPPWRVRV